MPPGPAGGGRGSPDLDAWIRDVFIDKAGLFGLVLEHLRERGEREARGLARLLERHGVPKGGEVLELGCGTGRVAVPLAAKGIPCHVPRHLEGVPRGGLSEGCRGGARWARGDS